MIIGRIVCNAFFVFRFMRNLPIDVLKIVMAFFVVCLHMHLLKEHYPELSYVLVNGLFRLGVPIFLLITGYYFYYINEALKLKKWLFRLFILYGIWTILYIPFWHEKDSALQNIVFGYHHLWYLIGTFFAGIILFILKKWSSAHLGIISLLIFGIGYCIQYLANSHYFDGKVDAFINQFPAYRNFLMVCFPFMTMGFLIKKHQLDEKVKPNLFLVIFACLLPIAEAYGNIHLLHLNKKESTDLLISLLISCPLLFLYCQNSKSTTGFKTLATFSTAIYFIHPMLMEWVFGEKDTLHYLLFFSMLIPAGILLVFLNKKLKYLL